MHYITLALWGGGLLLLLLLMQFLNSSWHLCSWKIEGPVVGTLLFAHLLIMHSRGKIVWLNCLFTFSRVPMLTVVSKLLSLLRHLFLVDMKKFLGYFPLFLSPERTWPTMTSWSPNHSKALKVVLTCSTRWWTLAAARLKNVFSWLDFMQWRTFTVIAAKPCWAGSTSRLTSPVRSTRRASSSLS